MSNYIECNDTIIFHPGYYLKEIIDESGLTREDFAKKLGITLKDLDLLLKGDKSLSVDTASRLSDMLGTTVTYWTNLQQTYDAKVREIRSKPT